jgi:hypothetical protein
MTETIRPIIDRVRRPSGRPVTAWAVTGVTVLLVLFLVALLTWTQRGRLGGTGKDELEVIDHLDPTTP